MTTGPAQAIAPATRDASTPDASTGDVPTRRVTLTLSLVSHTNVGKTTLARTLLREDIGEVRDEAHVTELAAAHVLIATSQGERLVLCDTPGFGDSARLLRRLESRSNPLGWFLSQVWDRFADRPFFSSQQAMRAVRESSDVVLYLANAAEDPTVGYLTAELRILAWTGKPVLVLLNQTGTQDRAHDERDEQRWRAAIAAHVGERPVLAFDAFARAWVQEDALLAAIEALLDPERRLVFARLRAAWRARNLDVFSASMRVLARSLAATACDAETLATPRLADRARTWLRGLAAGGERGESAELSRPMRALAARLEATAREATDELIRLHGLSGRAARDIPAALGRDFAVDRAADAGTASVFGGLASGAITGLAADLAAGGLTFGAGAVIGGVLGALGGGGLAQAYNFARGRDASLVQWSADVLDGRTTATLLRYLAVAHFGRGRGAFVTTDAPGHWRDVASATVAAHRDELAAIWRAARASDADARIDVTNVERRLVDVLTPLTRDVLVALYPQAAAAFDTPPVARDQRLR